MKFLHCSVILTTVFLIIAQATSTTSSYILTIEDNDQPVTSAFFGDLKTLISDLGGEITHEYLLIKGFTLDLSDEVVPTLQQKLAKLREKFDYNIYLEKDSEVHAYSSHDY